MKDLNNASGKVEDGQAVLDVAGREYPVIAFVETEDVGSFLPVVDIPQVTDEEWNRRAAEMEAKS